MALDESSFPSSLVSLDDSNDLLADVMDIDQDLLEMFKCFNRLRRDIAYVFSKLAHGLAEKIRYKHKHSGKHVPIDSLKLHQSYNTKALEQMGLKFRDPEMTKAFKAMLKLDYYSQKAIISALHEPARLAYEYAEMCDNFDLQTIDEQYRRIITTSLTEGSDSGRELLESIISTEIERTEAHVDVASSKIG